MATCAGGRSEETDGTRRGSVGVDAAPENGGARREGVATRSIHAGREPDGVWGALVTPLVQSTTYVQGAGAHGAGPALRSPGGHCYSRVSNPTVDALEAALGSLEEAPASVCFATGLAAETALLLALLRAGDHVVLGEAIYGGTVRLVSQVLAPLGIDATFVDSTDVGQVRAAIGDRTRLVFIETPANPTLALTDIAEVARITRAAGAVLAVDNTFLTPVLQRPLELGADVSVYSTTKHIEGHSTALGGAITSRDEGLLDRVRFIRKSTGAIQAPPAVAHGAWARRCRCGCGALRERLPHRTMAGGPPAGVACQLPGARHVSAGRAGPATACEPTPGSTAPRRGAVVRGAGAPRAIRVLTGVRLCSLVEHVGSVETL